MTDDFDDPDEGGRPRKDGLHVLLLSLMREAEYVAKATNKRFSARAAFKTILRDKKTKRFDAFRERWQAAGHPLTVGALEQEYLRAKKAVEKARDSARRHAVWEQVRARARRGPD